jgi:hypothetical protein
MMRRARMLMRLPSLLLFRTAVVYISIGQGSISMEEIGLLSHRPTRASQRVMRINRQIVDVIFKKSVLTSKFIC